MSLDQETYTPGGLMLKWATGLLVAGLLLDAVSLFSDLLQQQLLARYAAIERRNAGFDPQFVSEEAAESRERHEEASLAKLAAEGEANDARQVLIGILEVGLYLVTAVFFLRLLSRANRNARALGATGMEFTPGWCIGWFFVPFANLFKPFQAVREMWKASIATNGRWQDNPSTPLLGIWWTLWIANGILGQVVFRMSLRAESIPELQTLTSLSLVSDAAYLPLAIVALLMIRRLYALQDEKYQLAGVPTHVSPDWKSCRHCGESVDSMIGDCPMCGEPLGAAPADPQGENWRW